MTGLAAQGHIALHHWISCHGAHWGRWRDWRESERETERESREGERERVRVSLTHVEDEDIGATSY